MKRHSERSEESKRDLSHSFKMTKMFRVAQHDVRRTMGRLYSLFRGLPSPHWRGNKRVRFYLFLNSVDTAQYRRQAEA